MEKKLLKLLKISVNFVQNNFVLILICLLFLGTRLFRIDSIPSSVYWDEASIGYNAYSVLQTGKDEWGEFMPLHFRAFGEFKLPVYIYSVVLSESIFGLSIFAVRLPAVIFGLLSVVGLYLLVLKLTNRKTIALLSSFLFTIIPWYFIFSRTGYEATAGLAFFVWAIYFLMLSIKKNKMLLVSVVLFIASAYSYNSFRLLTPLVLGPAMLYFLIKKKFTVVIISVAFLLPSIFPLYKLYREDSGLSRLRTVGSNKNIITNYFNNFSSNYLFVGGDSNPRSQIPGSSQLYKLDFIFLILGFLYILKSKNPKYYSVLLFLFLAPIPAAITRENPHALRAILMSPVLSVISAFGVYYLLQIFKKQKKLILLVVIIFYALFFVGYFYKFVTKYNDLSKSSWQIEYKEIFEKQKDGCVADEFAQPYIFALFYQKVDPNEFIKSRVLNDVSDWGFSTVGSFGNFDFPKTCGIN